MAAVYLALDLRLNRRVAVKLYKGASAAEANQLVMREADAMALLDHENVVRVHDVGRLHARRFLVMEYLAGGTLRSWLTRRRRPWRRTIGLFLDAARGLAHVHEAGLIHRDFKPENVLVSADGHACVADLGLACCAGEVPDADCLGTPRYMAPEQRCGAPIDATVDQYAWCLALAEALAGSGAPPPLVRTLQIGLAFEPSRRHPSLRVLIARLEDELRLRVQKEE